MDDKTNALREKLAKALREVAELKVALDRAEGKLKGVRHDSVIQSLPVAWLGGPGQPRSDRQNRFDIKPHGYQSWMARIGRQVAQRQGLLRFYSLRGPYQPVGGRSTLTVTRNLQKPTCPRKPAIDLPLG